MQGSKPEVIPVTSIFLHLDLAARGPTKMRMSRARILVYFLATATLMAQSPLAKNQ